MRRVSSMVLAAVMAFGVIAQPLQAFAAGENAGVVKDYEIFPIPHNITYLDGDYILRDTVNVTYEAGIDDATKARVQEIAALKNLTLVEQAAVEGQTNLLVGIAGNEDTTVDEYIESKQLSDADLFTKTDSYILSSQNETIAILGKDVDSSFYGATTLYHIVKQLESRTIRNFVVKDYADVVSRGFIEGYYGNPWSTQDRINLMEWGGYYKLNSYFYAPKDDPKHNAHWKELYTPEEIETKIKPLAEAGNNSKCRFVFALHPYMYNPIRYDTEEHYQEDMNAMKAKFKQVVDAGVRQIAILADDAGLKRPQDYKRTLEDMTAWIQEMQKTYPDLKLNLPFCVQEYMNSVPSLPNYYTTFPANVQVMVTGGAVWGDVYKDYNTPFTNKFGRAPYLWVNWPCSDNSKNNLVMGGYQVLHSDVEPGTVAGIVLNPMQQSEPSKVGIFGNACYSWNIWTDEERAMAYDASFKYVEHNSAIETPASSALRELSKHMQNHLAGGSPRHNESVELAPKLNAFNQAMASKTLTAQQVDEMIAEFVVLQDAAKTLRAEGNPQLLGDINKPYTAPEANEQMAPWIDCWDDTTAAAIAYLNAVKASLGDTPDASTMLKAYNEGMEAFNRAGSHEFFYVNHMEKAQVGRQHIVPFINNLNSYLSRILQQEIDPDVLTMTYISDVLTNPVSGKFEDLFDGDDSTAVEFHEPLYIKANNYFGVMYNRPIDVTDIRVAMASGKNHFYHSKLQYTQDGEAWVDVNGEVYDRLVNDDTPIVAADLNLTGVMGLRLIATAENGVDAWVTIKGFDINTKGGASEVVSYPVTADGITIENAVVADNGHNKNKLVDGDKGTELWLKKSAEGADRDTTPAGAAVVLDLGEVKTVGSVYFAQGSTQPNDVIDAGVVEYSTDKATWHQLGTLDNQTEQTVTAASPVQARYIRVKNTRTKSIWWRMGEVTVYSANAPAVTPTYTGTVTVEGAVIPLDYASDHGVACLMDGNNNTELWITDNAGGFVTDKAAAVVDLGEVKTVGSVYFAQGITQPNDVIDRGVVEYSTDKSEWKTFGELDNSKEQTIAPAYPVNARYIRVRNTQRKSVWWRMAELTIYGPIPDDGKPDPHVYTSLDKTSFRVTMTNEDAAMSAGTVTLQPGDYFGMDLGEIRELSTLVLPTDLNGTTFQVSVNGELWTDVTADQAARMMALTADNISTSQIMGRRVRYLRFINNTNAAITLNVDQFSITNAVVGQLGKLTFSDIGNRGWGDTRNDGNAFDGNVNTATKFGGNPMQGNTAVYSLGREMDIHSIRVYNTDGECDYIRDAKIQLSVDGITWKDALTIGDGTTDTDRETNFGSINDPAKQTDPTYPNKFFYGNDAIADEVGKGARFLRVLITADYPERALVMNEIMLNGGTYLSPEANKAFEGTLEAPGHIPSNMLDKDLSTTYKPGSANGHMTYTLSNPDSITAVRFIQNGAVSHAAVTAEVLKNGAVETVALGTLSQAVNEFVTPAGGKILSVTITWTDKLPEIAEILLMKHEMQPADKAELEALTADGHEPENFANWTEDAKKEYLAVKEDAKKVLASEYASKPTVDTMTATLRAAGQSNADKVKANADAVKALQDLVDNKVSNKDYFYTTTSYNVYKAQLKKVTSALEDLNNLTQKTADKLAADTIAARDALAFSAYQREVATLTAERFASVDATLYTKASYDKLAAAKADIDTLIADPATEPAAFAATTAAYNAAYNALVPAVDSFQWNGASLSVAGNIAVNFFASIPEENLNKVQVEITVTDANGDKNVVTLPAADALLTDNGYQFTASVAVRQMNDDIAVKAMMNGKQIGDVEHFSVRQYADQILNDVGAVYADNVKAFVRTMLYHGAAMQQFKGYNTENLATKGLTMTDLENAEIDASKLPAASKTGSVADLELFGLNLSLQDETTLRYFFTKTNAYEAGKYTFTAGEKTYQPKENGSYVCVEIPNIAANHLNDVIVLSVNAGKMTVSYSPLTYARSVLLNKDAAPALVEVARSLVLYNAAALAL